MRSPRRWSVQPAPSFAEAVASEFRLHPTVAALLVQRGYDTFLEISRFLDPRIESLEPPSAFSGMREAVSRIQAAISRGEKILLYGDYDVDGVTGCAVLYPALKRLGAAIVVYIPDRTRDGYGLNIRSLEGLLEREKFSLVITVDNGITGAKAVEFLNANGVDTVIVDHHLPKEGMPKARAIVSAAVGDGGDENLAACGLAFKLVWALLGSFEAAKDSLDLVTVGTVADLAPVLGDNRILLKYGLSLLAKTKRPGLRALMDIAGINPRVISYRDIAFGLGPRINASGRMGSALDAFHLLVTEDAGEARRLARLLDDGNRERQKVEAAVFDDAFRLAQTSEDPRIVVVAGDDWHEGVLGIVAQRLVERLHRPAIVISTKNGLGKGSGRSVLSVSLFDEVSRQESFLDSFGGHAQACGLSIKKENIEAFRKALNQAPASDAPQSLPELLIDAELGTSELSVAFLKDLEKLAPFGPGNRKPLFLTCGLQLKGEAKKRGKDTLQCWMTDERGASVCEIVGFRAYERWMKQASQKTFDIVYQPALREYRGITSIQLQLEDWR